MEPFIEQFKTKIHVLWKPVFPPLNNKKKHNFSRNCELKSSFEGGGRLICSQICKFISHNSEKKVRIA